MLRTYVLWGVGIQGVYAVVLGLMPEGVRVWVGVGDVAGVWFYVITRYCWENSNNKIKLMCFPVKISKLAYPPIFLLVLMLLAWQIKLDAIIGIILALI